MQGARATTFLFLRHVCALFVPSKGKYGCVFLINKTEIEKFFMHSLFISSENVQKGHFFLHFSGLLNKEGIPLALIFIDQDTNAASLGISSRGVEC